MLSHTGDSSTLDATSALTPAPTVFHNFKTCLNQCSSKTRATKVIIKIAWKAGGVDLLTLRYIGKISRSINSAGCRRRTPLWIQKSVTTNVFTQSGRAWQKGVVQLLR